jgi:hypothetical protein
MSGQSAFPVHTALLNLIESSAKSITEAVGEMRAAGVEPLGEESPRPLLAQRRVAVIFNCVKPNPNFHESIRCDTAPKAPDGIMRKEGDMLIYKDMLLQFWVWMKYGDKIPIEFLNDFKPEAVMLVMDRGIADSPSGGEYYRDLFGQIKGYFKAAYEYDETISTARIAVALFNTTWDAIKNSNYSLFSFLESQYLIAFPLGIDVKATLSDMNEFMKFVDKRSASAVSTVGIEVSKQRGWWW